MAFSVWTVASVALGGALGAALRHLSATARWGPFRGIMLVNVLGSAALGTVVGLSEQIGAGATIFLGSGVCGALTTYSTLAVQTYEVWRRKPLAALGYLSMTTGLGLVAALVPLFILRS